MTTLHTLTQQHHRLGDHLGIELFVQRDDLLPYLLPGNKVRKVLAELNSLVRIPDVIITNGAIDSNHCRTTAVAAAELGAASHLVLHGHPDAADHEPALDLLRALGASYVIVEAKDIHQAITDATAGSAKMGKSSHVIPGGCHTRSGAIAYRHAGIKVMERVMPDTVIVASGTGATQGGLIAAASAVNPMIRVIGISVARMAGTGSHGVFEAAEWAGATDSRVEFDDRYVAGGYARFDDRTIDAVDLGWRFGLPLDYTYTGKAFAALIDHTRGTSALGRVLFWHTGGLWNYLRQGQLARN